MSGVNVLAVMDRLGKEWRDDSQIVGRLDSADALDSVRAAVAELIAALETLVDSVDPESTGWDEAVYVLSRVRGAE